MIRHAAGPTVARLAVALAQFAAVSVIVFLLTSSLPGDAAEIVLGRDATAEQIATLRAQLGLDRPLTERFVSWLGGLVQGDLGTSLVTGRPVVDEVGDRLGVTALLTVVSLAVLVPLALAAGTVAGRRPGSTVDRGLTGLLVGLQAVPEFALGLVLVGVFALQLAWLPATAAGGAFLGPAVLVLPVVVLVANQLGRLARQIRVGVVATDTAEHVVHLRRLGLPERTVLLRHVLPGAALPSIQQLARIVDSLLGGVVVVEALFALPGVGSGFVEAVGARDLPVVQGYALLYAATTIGVNLVADLVSARLTPQRAVLA
ncbi:ABC transporter permease [Pseudonocardia endophytica]|uniref:Peptide/nickel transport system permease protein n=1 Tax=Pseudonocardia endophytica TaxID=401976 RepID=A0A4R1HQ70_PSEEN|nr:ABC transporter permease [Pseudonocardia endophytica]TCK22845.1 peptide/nickel transport system permease protein [Pseudonocardia endophytica]